MDQLINLLVFLIPVYVANAAPVMLGGGRPLDFGIVLSDGERLLGNGKTMRGFMAGILAGTVAGGLVALYYTLPFFENVSVQFIAAFVLSVGTMSGDAIGSFIKRRAKVSTGRPFVLDTVFFLLVSLAFVFPFAKSQLYEPANILFVLVLTLIMHPLTNAMANRAGLKNVPW